MSSLLTRSNQLICRKLYSPLVWSSGPCQCPSSCQCSTLVLKIVKNSTSKSNLNLTQTRPHYFTVLHHYSRKMTNDGQSGSGSNPDDPGSSGSSDPVVPEIKKLPSEDLKIVEVVNQSRELQPIVLTKSTNLEDLTTPTNCCMTGCANCVWIDYVEQLSKFYSDPSMSRDRVRREIAEIDNFMIKGFLEFELKTRGLL